MKKKQKRKLPKIADCWLYAVSSKKDLARRLSTEQAVVTSEDLEKLAVDANNFKLFTTRTGRDIQLDARRYLGSTYVNQFNKFGRVFQVYVQGDAQFRLTPEAGRDLTVRNKNGDMIPLGTVLDITPSVGPSLISLYNLYPSAIDRRRAGAGFSSGDAIKLMESVAADGFRRAPATEWTALSYQEKLVGSQMYLVFALALLLVYLVLAGQYESWFAPVAVLLAAPLSLIGPVSVLTASTSTTTSTPRSA